MKDFAYEGKTGIALSEEWAKKLLADFVCNIGCVCHFACSYCYAFACVRKLKYVRNVVNQGYGFGEFSLYRTKANVVEQVSKDLKRIRRGDRGVVHFCSTCDPCATSDHVDTTIEAIKVIMSLSDLEVRVLSKCDLIYDVALALERYRDRIMYGLSTGTSLPEISAAVEVNATPIANRVGVLHGLQDEGFRTYGMICPVLPSEIDKVGELIEQVRPEKCEHVWAEAINVRGKSFLRTRDALLVAGLDGHASALKAVTGNKQAWCDYSKKLFLALQAEMKERGQLRKLRFLQYVSKHDVDFFSSQEEAICLGNVKAATKTREMVDWGTRRTLTKKWFMSVPNGHYILGNTFPDQPLKLAANREEQWKEFSPYRAGRIAYVFSSEKHCRRVMEEMATLRGGGHCE